ncbi:7-cyano-7-deazaguanine/7-aminomethyl-7-deazaguanine transporter [Gallaecimonas mangrovi]|uniref:7-cyano-7-deazaguanine/7-aminomethyl-7- deazaguanine transporter n=1 Tax=Gallaecimonas mangrovi TaxID=2291597 RepID=UPI000E202E2E|nr:7-cyano-7-deazaguanine/7-aminomethyl-7-deazaguanine transporter [Gallaecimonas mangrovi]
MFSHSKARALAWLIGFHILVIAASNYLVQIPFSLFGLHTTWGAFTFPFIFLATDLTVRLLGAEPARRVIFWVMLPALFISYGVSVVFPHGHFAGPSALSTLNTFVARIALASFLAYVLGQVLDVQVFNRLRRLGPWWLAPAASTVLGNLFDTLVFFGGAFYQSTDPFMASHWLQIAWMDYAFKLLVSLAFFLPLYGMLLNGLLKWQRYQPTTA